VKNKGTTAGREIAEIYVSKPETTLEQPSKELCGFAKTKLLQPGESETLKITVTSDELYSYDTANSRYIVDRGVYKFYAASSAEKTHGEATAEIKETRLVCDVENRCAPNPVPDRIIKSEYKVPEPADDKDAIANIGDAKKSGSAYEVDLGSDVAVGRIYMEWEGLNAPVIISIAKEDKEFVRYDVIASTGLVIIDEDLHGVTARYIRFEPVSSSALKILNIYRASESETQTPHTVYENLALHKPVKAASVENAGYSAANAVDGNLKTRWSSLPSGECWYLINLQEVKRIKGMMFYLESAYVPYRVEYSADGDNYTTLASFGAGELFVKLKDLDIEAKYVRFVREGENWFSIYEVEIYGE
jgi:hypothetical protein